MSFFTDVFKAVATVATDVTAKATSLAIHGAAEVAGVFDENAKKNVHYAALEAEKQIRRNPIIDAINEIDNNERELTKRLIRYIDTIHDLEHPEESTSEFTQRVHSQDLWKYASLTWLPYCFHTLMTTWREYMVNDLISGNPDSVIKMCQEQDLELDHNSLRDTFASFKFKHVTKNYYVARSNVSTRGDTCLIGFCGTVTSDLNHLIADASIGNLVAGYHYKMADLACELYDTVLKNELQDCSNVVIVGHSLGGGIAMYLNLLMYMFQESGEFNSEVKVNSWSFGVPCVLPRVFKNRLSRRMINIIDHHDPVPKYYKNDAVAHANNLVHIDGNDPIYRHHGMFAINFARFNPLNQIEKFNYDADNLDFHYMKNYLKVCKHTDTVLHQNPRGYKY
jgi:hypothetical protein